MGVPCHPCKVLLPAISTSWAFAPPASLFYTSHRVLATRIIALSKGLHYTLPCSCLATPWLCRVANLALRDEDSHSRLHSKPLARARSAAALDTASAPPPPRLCNNQRSIGSCHHPPHRSCLHYHCLLAISAPSDDCQLQPCRTYSNGVTRPRRPTTVLRPV